MLGTFEKVFSTKKIIRGEVAELVEGARLEIECTWKRTVGSNPTLSATKSLSTLVFAGFYHIIEKYLCLYFFNNRAWPIPTPVCYKIHVWYM